MTLRYLVDTNTLSEPTRPRPNPRVWERLLASAGTHATAAVCWQELRFGVQRLPRSKRRTELERVLEELERTVSILPFDQAAAEWLATERAHLEGAGRLAPIVDGMIASVAATRRLTLVTRNVRDFAAYRGISVESWHE